MTKKQIQDDLKNEFLALAFCKNENMTKAVEAEIKRLKELLAKLG